MRLFVRLVVFAVIVTVLAPAYAQSVEFTTHPVPVFPDGEYVNGTIGDADNDGRNELVVVSAAGGVVRIGEVDAQGRWTLEKEIALGAAPSGQGYVSPHVADLDGDGDNDLAFWRRGNGVPGSLFVASYQAAGYTVVTYSTPELECGYNMSLADVNGDQLLDVLTTNFGFSVGSAKAHVLYNGVGPARFATSAAYDVPPSTADKVYGHDLDADGDVDLIVTSHPFGSLGATILTNNGSGSFTATDLNAPDGSRSGEAAIGDVDGDGDVDIVTNATVPHSFTDRLTIYRRAGASYTAESLTAGQEPLSPKLADFNGDGLLDLIVDNTRDRALAFFVADSVTRTVSGTPRTISSPELSAGDHGAAGVSDSLSVGDLDHDGRTDILFAVSRVIFIRNASVAPGLTLNSISPTSGPASGGTSVTITGTNFAAGATVTIGGTAASVVSVTATTITATTLARAAGAADVVVRNPDGQTRTLTAGFTFVVAATGDANGDGGVTVGDVFYMINNLFAGGPGPIGSGDVNGDGAVTVGDVFYLINFLFAGGPAPR